MGRRGEGQRPGPKGWRRLEVANSRQGAHLHEPVILFLAQLEAKRKSGISSGGQGTHLQPWMWRALCLHK